MNILLWILQIPMALLLLAGGSYKMSNYEQISDLMKPLGQGATGALGAFEMLAGALLILPLFIKKLRPLVPAVAGALVVEDLLLSGLNASHSLKIEKTNPLVWTLSVALVAGFIAWGRRRQGRNS